MNILIFDLGGGTVDVSLMTIENNTFEVKATSGNTSLGGSDFDDMMTNYCIDDFTKKTRISLNGNARAVVRLRTACERAKIALSSAQEVFIEVESLAEGVDYSAKIDRLMFEDYNKYYFRDCIKPVKRVLKDSKLPKHKIDEIEIVLVGGSSRIPKIRQLIQEFFNGKELCSGINPDETVGYGAAVIGGILSWDYSEQIQDAVLLDVAPFSLGVETIGGKMNFLIDRNTSIPIAKTTILTTGVDNAPGICIQVFEGENPTCRDNKLLGSFNLEGIDPAPRGVPQIEVTLSIDADSILEIRAKDLNSGKALQVTVANEYGRLSKEYINQALKEFANYKKEEELCKKKAEGRNKLDDTIHTARVIRELFDKKIREIEDWIEQNPNAEAEELDEKTREIEEICRPLDNGIIYKERKQANFQGMPKQL